MPFPIIGVNPYWSIQSFHAPAVYKALKRGQPSTPICFQNRAFQLNRGNSKTLTLFLSQVDGKSLEQSFSKTMTLQQSRDFSVPEFSSNAKFKMNGDCRVFKFLRRNADGKYFLVFRSKPLLSNSFGIV